MSTTIDSKVVEMKFDNSNFEKNAQQSMSTLDKLKNLLNNSSSGKSLEELGNAAAANNVKFDGLSNSVQNVASKFSALEIAGITALVNITNRAVDAGIKLTKSLSVDNIAAGWTKFEEKTRSVGTLVAQGYDMSTVDDQLERLAWFTDETSYNFTDMVSNISKFTATGQKLDTSVKAMEGIANWAALSGQNATKASQAMYQLSQAMGKGVLKYDDWKSIQNASMDTQEFRQTAVDSAVALGQLKKVGEDCYETLNKKRLTVNDLFGGEYMSKTAWFTSDVMMDVFGKYSSAVDQLYEAVDSGNFDTASEAIEGMNGQLDEFGLKAFKAAQEARTWSDVLDSVKDAVSSGWMQTFELLFGNYEEATSLFTTLANQLWEVFAGGAEGRNDFISDLVTPSWKKLQDQILDTGIEMDTFQKALTETAKEHGIDVEQMIKEQGSFEEAIKQGWLTTDLFSETIENIIKGNGSLSDSTKEAAESFKDLGNVVQQVIDGKMGNGEKRIKALTDAGYDYATVQDLVNRTLKGEKINYDEFNESVETSTELTLEQVDALVDLENEAYKSDSELQSLIETINKPSARELVVDGILNSIQALIDTISIVKEAWSDIFPPERLQEKIYSLCQRFKEFTETLLMTDEKTDKLKRTFKGLFASLDIVFQLFSAVANAVRSILEEFGFVKTGVLDATASIGDYIVALDDSIRENQVFANVLDPVVNALKTVIKWFKEAATNIKLYFKQLSENKSFQQFTNYIRDKFNTAIEIFNKKLEKASEDLKKIWEWFAKIKNEKLELVFEKITNFFDSDKWKGISSVFEEIKDWFVKLKDAFVEFFTTGDVTQLSETFSQGFSDARIEIEKFATVIGDKLKELTPLFAAGGVIAGFIFFGNALKKVDSIISSFKNGFGVFDSISGYFSELKKKVKYDEAIKIALAIGIVVAALYALTKIPEQDLIRAGIALAAIAGGLAVLSLSISLMNKTSGGNGAIAALSMLELSASLGIIVGCLIALYKVMGDKTLKDMIPALEVLGILVAGLAVVATVLSYAAPELSKGGVGLLLFAASLGVIVNILIKISDPSQAAALENGIWSLMPVFVALAAVATFIDRFSFNSAMGVIVTALGLVVTLKVLNYICEHKLDIEKIYDSMGTLIALFVSMLAIAEINNRAGKASGGIGMLFVATSMLVIVQAMKSLAKIPDDAVWKVTVLSLVLGGIVTALIWATGHAGEIKIAPVIAMAAAMMAIAVELMLLSKIPAEKLIAPIIGLSACVLALAEAMNIMQYAFDQSSLWNNIKVSGILVMAIGFLFSVGIVLAMLSALPWKGMLSAAASLSLVIISLGIMFKTLNGVELPNKGALLSFLVACGSLYLIAVAISKIASFSWQGILSSGASLGIAINAVAAAMLIVSKSGPFYGDQLLAFAAACGGLLVIAIAISKIAGFSWQSILASAAGLSLVIIAVSGALVLVNLASKDALSTIASGAALALACFSFIEIATAINMLGDYDLPKLKDTITIFIEVIAALTICCSVLGALGPEIAALGAIGLDILIANLILILEGLGQLGEADKAVIENGLDVISLISEGFGKAVSSFAEGLTDSLPGIGTNLSDFMNNVQPFLDGCKNASASNIVEGAKNLAEAIAALTGADLLSNIVEHFTGENPLTVIASSLTDFAAEYTKFADSVSDIDQSNLDKASKVITTLVSLTSSLPKTGGIIPKWLTGDNSIQSFCKGLSDAGTELKNVSNVGSLIYTENVNKFKKSLELLIELSDTIPVHGGLKSAIFGDDSIQKFCSSLGDSAIEIKTLADASAKTDIIAVSRFKNCMLELLQLEPEITEKHGGIVQFATGDDSIQKFCKNLGDSASELKILSDMGKDTSPVYVSRFTVCVKELLQLEPLISENHGGLKSLFVGDDSIQKFCKGLRVSAQSVADLSIYSESIVYDNVKKFTDSIKLLTGLGYFINDYNSYNISGKAFAQSISTLLEGCSNIYSDLSTIDTDDLKTKLEGFKDSIADLIDLVSSSEGLTNLSDTLGKTSKNMLSAFASAIEDGGQLATEALYNWLVSNVASQLTDAGEILNRKSRDTATNMMKAFERGIKDYSGNVYSTISAFTSTVMSRFDSGINISHFVTLGQNMLQGLINGLKNEDLLKATYETIDSVCSAILTRMHNALGCGSPSRITNQYGQWVTEGLSNGIVKNESMAYKSAEKVSEGTIKAMSEALSSAADMLDTDMELNPVIAPVIDLSNVQNGVSSINSMFNKSLSMTASKANSVGTVNSVGTSSENSSNESGNQGITYVQNNYSPKSLSRIEIYRQTQAQLLAYR